MRKIESDIREYLSRNNLVVKQRPITPNEWTAHILAAECINIRTSDYLYFPTAVFTQLFKASSIYKLRALVLFKFLETEYRYFGHSLLTQEDLDTIYILNIITPGRMVMMGNDTWSRVCYRQKTFKHFEDVKEWTNSDYQQDEEFEAIFEFTYQADYVNFLAGVTSALKVLYNLAVRHPHELSF